MPIPLSQPQFLAIANAAAALCPLDRDAFLAAVAAALEGLLMAASGARFATCNAALLTPSRRRKNHAGHAIGRNSTAIASARARPSCALLASGAAAAT